MFNCDVKPKTFFVVEMFSLTSCVDSSSCTCTSSRSRSYRVPYISRTYTKDKKKSKKTAIKEMKELTESDEDCALFSFNIPDVTCTLDGIGRPSPLSPEVRSIRIRITIKHNINTDLNTMMMMIIIEI